MEPQKTLQNQIYMTGFDCYGGSEINVTLKPADPNTGILFQTPKGDVKASLENATASKNSILLSQGNAKVIAAEHMLATLYSYGVDNAIIEVKRTPSRSFAFLNLINLATGIEVIPYFNQREQELCKQLDLTELITQDAPKKLLTVYQNFSCEKLTFQKIERGLVMSAITDYKVPGEQSYEIEISPESYRDKLSRARPYAKEVPTWMPLILTEFIASVAYPSFGFGHGFDTSNVFLPVKTIEEWKSMETYDAEIARHTIIDRLGALALLDGKLEQVKVTARYSNHSNDLRVLKNIVKEKMIREL